jgi:hypothetical protein
MFNSKFFECQLFNRDCKDDLRDEGTVELWNEPVVSNDLLQNYSVILRQIRRT